MQSFTTAKQKRVLSVCLLGLLSVLFSTQLHAAREVSAKRECATCHIMWLDEFKRTDIKSLIPYDPKPVTRTGKQDVSSTERMCFSCHDGFVLDDRYMWKDDAHWHPTGVKPPKDMEIQTIKGKRVFPMNEDGKVYCGTCHSAHGVDWASSDATIFLRVKNVDSKLCLGCHEPKSSGPKHGNHPVNKVLKKKPEELVEAGARFGKKGSVICQSCHRPHGGKQEKMLVISNRKAGLCYTCHEDKRGVVDSKHDMTVMAPELTNIYKEKVKDVGPCIACHIPHGGKGPALWARDIPPDEKDRTAAMCTTCHNEDSVAKKKQVGIHSHPLNKDLKELGITVDKDGWHSQHSWAQTGDSLQALPLFDKHGQRTKKQGTISCPTCHDPHNWSVKEELKKVDDPKEAEGDANTSFLRIAQDRESKLCMNCHVDKRTIKVTSHDIEEDEHGEEKDTCTHCHAVHNAKGVALRGRERGPGKAAIETWCRDCHRKDGLATDRLIAEHSHPVGVEPKQITENSALPLFDDNGKRTEHNGVVDCASCHNPHQWTPQLSKPASDDEKEKNKDGDGTNSFLRVAAGHDAKLCLTCHKDKGLIVGTDHDMQITARSSKNALGQSVHESGICGQCHAVHKPAMNNSLFAREAGEGHDIKEQQCRSCHSKDGVASKKIPPALQHPDKVTAWSGETRQLLNRHKLPDVPVFDEQGKRAQSGIISCPSCHNPHQWNPRKKEAGKGKNLEGDAMTSFLRNANSEYIVCADCHGQDALFRYKYYHSKTSRKDYPLYR